MNDSEHKPIVGITNTIGTESYTWVGKVGSIINQGVIYIEQPISNILSPYGYTGPRFRFTVSNTTGLNVHLSTDLHINQGELFFDPPGPLSAETTIVETKLIPYTSNQFTFNVIVSVTEGDSTVSIPFSMTCLEWESTGNADPHFTPFF